MVTNPRDWFTVLDARWLSSKYFNGVYAKFRIDQSEKVNITGSVFIGYIEPVDSGNS